MKWLTALGVFLLAVAAALGGLWWTWGRDLPSVTDLDVLEFSGQTRVYDRTGALMGTLTPSLDSGGSVNRDLLRLGDISPKLQKAVVTSEDRRFFEHHGVDYIGIVRGLLKGVLQNDLEGGSSITQQVVKNTLLADLKGARTPERKFKEAVLAYELDSNYEKNKILAAYLNVVYWGDAGRSDIVGAGTAAQAYFGVDAGDLNLAQSVYLATIIPAPNRRYRDFAAYRPLMKDLLGRMVEDGRVTRGQAAEAWRTPIYPAGWRIGWNDDGTLRSAALENPDRRQQNLDAFSARQGSGNRYASQYALQAVEKELLPKVGRRALYGGGKIYTGLSAQAQAAAERASLEADNLPQGATLGAALVSPQSGEVLALVGQKLTGDRPSDWNNATQARRQVGSSIKPLLYTLALSRGFKQDDTVLDAPITGTDYQPQNYDGRWTGRYVTMRYALDHSLNLPTVRIAQEIGIPAFADKLRSMGFEVPQNLGLSLSIGTLEASPLQMAAAYAAFANGGLYYAPTLVRRMEDDRGRVIYARPAPTPKRVWDAQTAWLGLDMIRGVVNDLTERQGGLATRAQIDGREVGGKTGTTNDIKDLWFAGVTPTVAGAVWVGIQAGGAMPSWAYSGTVPTPVWRQAVAGALDGQPAASFQEPAGITYRSVRQVDMAFRTADADQEPGTHDGTVRQEEGRQGGGGAGGFFGGRGGGNSAPADPQAAQDQQAADPQPPQDQPSPQAQDSAPLPGDQADQSGGAGTDASGQIPGGTATDPGSGTVPDAPEALPADPFQTGEGQTGEGQTEERQTQDGQTQDSAGELQPTPPGDEIPPTSDQNSSDPNQMQGSPLN